MMAQVGTPAVEAMAAMMLPSTLVKTLYLFFDLPPRTLAADAEAAAADSGPTHEQHDQLQADFACLLSRLCRFSVVTEELRKSDDLARLYDMLISPCPSHNLSWHALVGATLRVLVAEALGDSSISYLHKKGSIARCVAALQQSDSLQAPEISDIVLTLFATVKVRNRRRKWEEGKEGKKEGGRSKKRREPRCFQWLHSFCCLILILCSLPFLFFSLPVLLFFFFPFLFVMP